MGNTFKLNGTEGLFAYLNGGSMRGLTGHFAVLHFGCVDLQMLNEFSPRYKFK